MNPDDPLEQLKALKQTGAGTGGPPPPNPDPLEQLKATRPVPPPSTGNPVAGLVTKGLNMATLGLNEPFVGLTSAMANVARHGIYAHPIDTYNATTHQMDQDVQAAETQHPYLATGAGAAGFGATFLVDAPIRALLGLPEAAVATETGAQAAVKRILGSAKTGAATGAVVSGIGARGTPGQKLGQVVGGGLLGGVLGGGAQSAEELMSGAGNFLRSVMQPVDEKAGGIVDRRIVSHLGIDGLTPSDVQTNAQQAVQTGSPSVLAHLGGPALDPLSYLGAASSTQEGSQLKSVLKQAQLGEHDLLQRGVTEMSGIPNTPENQSDMFLQGLEDTRKAAGQRDYPPAYAQPNITDPNILKAIRRDPDLRASLNQGVQEMQRDAELERIQTGDEEPKVVNPLSVKQPSAEPVLSPEGEELVNTYKVPRDKVIALGYVQPQEPADAPEIPVKMLDYMKQGVDPVIARGLQKGKFAARGAGVINAKVQALLDQVNNPVYDAARSNQAALFGLHKSGTEGQSAFTQAPEMIGAKIADLSPEQANAYKTTATSGLRDMLSGNGYTTNLEKTVLDNPRMQGQLSALYGDDAATLGPYQTQARSLNRVASEATGGSQTEPRAQIRREIVDQGGNDVLNTLLAPKRGLFNVPGKLLDAKNKKVQDAVLQILASRLKMPAGSQALQDYIQQLQTPLRTRYGPLTSSASPLLGLLSGQLTTSGNRTSP